MKALLMCFLPIFQIIKMFKRFRNLMVVLNIIKIFLGKIVSIACHNMQNGIIAVGTSSGCLLIFSVIDGSTKSRFTIGEANSSCVVWCLLFVK